MKNLTNFDFFFIRPTVVVAAAPNMVRADCKTTEDCKVENSECVSGICLPIAQKLEDECAQSVQCKKLEGSECKNGHCSCDNEHRSSGDKCILNKSNSLSLAFFFFSDVRSIVARERAFQL